MQALVAEDIYRRMDKPRRRCGLILDLEEEDEISRMGPIVYVAQDSIDYFANWYHSLSWFSSSNMHLSSQPCICNNYCRE